LRLDEKLIKDEVEIEDKFVRKGILFLNIHVKSAFQGKGVIMGYKKLS